MQAERKLAGPILAGLVLLGLAIRLYFAPMPGHSSDMGTFGSWATTAASAPWNQGYEKTNINYPPGALLIFELIGRAYRAFVHIDPNLVALRVAVKLPTILFDLIGGVLAYALARRFVAVRPALAAAAMFLLNPAIVYDSAYWGQNDAITAVLAFAAIAALVRGWRIAAWLLLAFAILNKPPVAVLTPLLVLEPFAAQGDERRRRLAQTGIGIVGALALAYVTAIPFYTDRSVFGVFHRMFDSYRTGSSLYPYNSANAFNVYALTGNFFQTDRAHVLGVTMQDWSYVAFLIALIVIAWRYTILRTDVALLEASFLTMLAFFFLMTEMHERYLLYALVFLPVLAVLQRRFLWADAVLTLTAWLNMEYSIDYMWISQAKPPGINPDEISPVLVHLCALANLGVLMLCGEQYLQTGERTESPALANGGP